MSAYLWGKRVRESPEIQSDLVNYVLVVVAQLTLIYIYPVYNYIFMGLSAVPQSAFTLLLPLMKIIAKNYLAHLFRNMEDLKPEMVILNVEVFHALFVAVCTQRSTSINTTILLIFMDFVHACMGLHDTDMMLSSLNELLQQTRANIRSRSKSSSRSAITIRLMSSLPSMSSISANLVGKDLDLLDVTMFLLSIDEQLRANLALRSRSHTASLRQRSVAPEQQQIPPSSVQQNSLVGMTPNAEEDQNRPPPVAAAPANRYSTSSPTANVILKSAAAQAVAVHLSDADEQMLRSMSSGNRALFVHQTLQLLHFTEFMLLVEFTEVIIPAIYCVYLGVISHLPNRQFYAGLRDLDDASMWRNISNVMVYATLEIVSFILLSALLYRKVRISPLNQLAFVLATQWQLVQSKLIIWVVFTVQTSLDHFGVDYSFKFAWLH